MAISMKKIDGTYSLTMVWNTVVIILTAIFGVAVATLPEIKDAVPQEVYVVIAIIVKGIDIGLRQITSLPMDKDS